MSENQDELIKAQNELIGVLFEIIKRLQSNNDLDTEYFKIIGNVFDKSVGVTKIIGFLFNHSKQRP